MQFNLEKLDKNFVSVGVVIDTDEINAALAEAYKKVVQKVNLPGFRKGHIPRPILEKQFGKEVFFEDALDIMVQNAYRGALDELKLEPIAQPELDVTEGLEPEKPFNFKIKMEVLPEVTLGEYKGLMVEKKAVTVDDDQVEKRLQDLRERHAQVVPSNKQVLETGDFAIIDFEGFLDGTPFSGGAAQGHSLEIGSKTFIPGFEEQLVGMSVGTEKEITVKFPDDYQGEELAGKDAIFKVSLKEIKVKELPELDDDFAQSIGKFETLEALKADLKTKMTTAAQQEAESAYSQALIDLAVGSAIVDVPETLIVREMDEMVHQFQHSLSYQGLNFEQYLKYVNKTEADVLQEFRPDAEKRVKTDLVLTNIAKAEQMDVSEPELDEKIFELAGRYQRKDVAKFKKDLKSKGRLEDIKQSILLEKAAEYLKGNAVSK